MFYQLFSCLNQYCLYGKEFFAKNPKYLDILIAFGYEAMLNSNEKATLANHAEGALLLHIIIQCLHQIMTKE